ncbi:hypothetical protein V6N13_090991 [Hibiscus sabdariffa]|uniref:Dirigent protein n=1 Tax=Hibiscus sabdariffa TaxID=183260 RepID=A0ABR2R363_9ROSI
MIEGGEYNDNLNFYGVYKIRSTMSHVSVTGGTGKFKNACGVAEVRPIIPPGHQYHVTDGAEDHRPSQIPSLQGCILFCKLCVKK